MDPTTLEQVAAACGGTLLQGDGACEVTCISKDTRTLQPGELYWVLEGGNFDGHEFVAAAAAAGAAGAVVGRAGVGVPADFPLIVVPDTLEALRALALWHRARLGARVICLTGSNGKTSTKDFAAAVAGVRFSVTKTQGNLNNHIGLPLTILSAATSDEVAVWEIGMNHAGEIAPLARMARPDIGIITNVGVAHIENLGSREAIAQEKGMLGEELDPRALLILPAADDFTPALAARTPARVVLAGGPDGVRAENLRPSIRGIDCELVCGAERVPAHLPVTGSHMVRNALLAVTAGRELGIPLADCARGLAGAEMSKGRLACSEVRGVTVLDDSYNANPDSVVAALVALRELPVAGRRFAVLGGMAELGDYAAEGCRQVGRAAAAHADVLIVVGELARPIAGEARAAGAVEVHEAADTAAAAGLLRAMTQPGDAVVVKGSRSTRMERVLEDFC